MRGRGRVSAEAPEVLCYLCARYVATTLTGGGVRVCGKCLVALLDETAPANPLGMYWRHGAACKCSGCS